MASQPAAFMSYVRFNDQHDDGQLSQFRERLAAEIRVQTGKEFPIFQDRTDIAWGQNWRQRINETLDAVTLLLPIITPSFFHSTACRDELERFLAREQKLGRQDLILPVYYVTTPELDDPERRDADPLASAVASRQFADWRELRFEPFTSLAVRRTLAQLASRIRDVSWQQRGAGQGSSRPNRPIGYGPAHTPAISKATPARTRPRVDPPTHVVDPYERGDFTTISAAIEAARPGDRILVRPGLYREGLVINKPLEIIGDGPLADIEIRARDANAILFQANIGRIANLTLHQEGDAESWNAVDISQGRLELEGCEISSLGTGVAIRDGADPRIRSNRIHSGRTGVVAHAGGYGTLEDNEITATDLGGVWILGGNLTARRNHIHHNKWSGVIVSRSGLGILEENEIAINTYGVDISENGNSVIRRNKIHHNRKFGVIVGENGLATLEDNDIVANDDSGAAIDTGGNADLRRNRIGRNKRVALLIAEGGQGTIEDNNLTNNEKGAWEIDASAEANVTKARNEV